MKNHRYICAIGVLTIIQCDASQFAYAGDQPAAPAVDKSQYDLFNPVPDDAMRSFTTDRPTKNASPYSIDAGHIQYEADIANWTYDSPNRRSWSSALVIGAPTMMVGLTNDTDFEVALAPINNNRSHDANAHIRSDYFGFGDVDTRLKVNLFGNDGGDAALAIVPYVKMPTAPVGIGNGYWEGGAYMPFGASLPDGWALSITSEIDFLEDASKTGVRPNFQNLINFSHSIFTDSVTCAAEFWADVNTDRGAATQYTLDFALSWLATSNLQFDVGINIGLNQAAPDTQLYLGISQRF
jgi:hypothetical protein